jgi:regulator of sigma E protease
VLGVLIFVHELGHFLAARRIGVRVLTFSLGFGPKLLRVTRGDTEYCLSAIPLGGYVKMAGENPDDPRSGSPDEFLSRSKWERFQILIMGPVMNILLALVVMTGVLYRGAEVPAYEQQPPVVGSVDPGSPAERAGIRPGDRIVSVAGRPVDTWERFFIQVAPRAGQRVEIGVRHADGRETTAVLVPDSKTRFQMGDIGVLPVMHPMVRAVNAGQPADKAGIEVGDVVLAVNGEPVTPQKPLVETIKASANVPLRLTIQREGRVRDVVVTPEKQDGVGKIGVVLNAFEIRIIKPGFLRAVQMSFERNRDWSTLIVQTLAGLFSGETSPKQLMGPVGIAQLSGDAARAGLIELLTLMAMISLNLGLLNLLPIPVLDGGHIMILALEGLARRDLSTAVKEKVLLAGFVVLMLLMVTVIYNDLMRIAWVERLMPWR